MNLLSAVLAAGAVIITAMTAHTDAPPPVITTCFAPEGHCAAQIIGTIAKAQHEILVHAYTFTTNSGIAEGLANAKARGVDVEVIADKTTPCEARSAIPLMTTAGIPVWIDDKLRIAHAKVLIIDGRLVIAGSYNFSVSAAYDSEDLVFIDSPDIAAAYTAHWKLRQARSVAYTSAAQWCAHGVVAR